MGRKEVAAAGRAEALSGQRHSLLVRGSAWRGQRRLDAFGRVQYHGEGRRPMVVGGRHLRGH